MDQGCHTMVTDGCGLCTASRSPLHLCINGLYSAIQMLLLLLSLLCYDLAGKLGATGFTQYTCRV